MANILSQQNQHSKSSQKGYELGMVGLGVMGRNLLLNMADNGFSVAGYDREQEKVETLRTESQNREIEGAEDISSFVALLRQPRAIMLLVPAGAPVDEVINDLRPYLQKGDIIIDAGNSYYKDTNIRGKNLANKGIQFFGVGVSGGEEGARHGPSIMPGGDKKVYERLKPIFEATAAKVNGDPCVAYLGPGSAGHFVKMVHNGIEYGLMQLISETYDLMKRGLGFNNEQLHQVYAEWNKGYLNSYLLEITANIFKKKDEVTGRCLIDEILGVAEQKGTGMWTSQVGMELQVPIPTIDLAVGIRDLSMIERNRASQLLQRPTVAYKGDKQQFVQQLQQAFYVAMIVTYAQGMALLSVASTKFNYNLNLETIARIWRGGCIIRAILLEDIRHAFENDPYLSNLLLDSNLSKKIISNEEQLRKVICAAVNMGLPVPAFMTTLAYIDGYRSAWLPTNLLQAQRDYFGAHTYERIDQKGIFHTEWD